MDPEDLDTRTWLQLKECTRLAMAALAQITAESTDERQQVRARATLVAIAEVLSEDWEGPAT